MKNLDDFISDSALNHSRLCPRQILGIRIGLAGGAALGIKIPPEDKALLVIAETDGCFISGLVSATGCGVHHRTLRIEYLGKVAATFVEVDNGKAIRIVPRPDVRQRAFDFATGEVNEYEAQLLGYQKMPDDQLLILENVQLNYSVSELISKPGLRVQCERCDEEIINQREVYREGQTLCQTCAGFGYYKTFIKDFPVYLGS